MDPISSINIKKDTSLALILEAQNRGYDIHYMNMNNIYLHNGKAWGSTRLLSIKHNYNDWYCLDNEQDINLGDLDIILMRKDPPFDTEFLYATHILEHAESQGALVVNKPQGLRDCNEKLFATLFANYMPDTLVSCYEAHIRAFWLEHGDIILKPLGGMGGASVFRIKRDDPNLSVIIENMTNYGKRYCMAQSYLPAIKYGDKRVLVVDGEPIPYCLARIPKTGETRGNLAAGGQGEARPLSDTDWKIALDIAPVLRKKGLIFAGLDIIGDRLTEINITSPTCVREIETTFPISITSSIMDAIEKRLATVKC